MEEKKVWGIHNKLDAGLFLEKHVVGVGIKGMGNLSLIEPNREAYKDKLSTFSDGTKQSIAIYAGLLYRFVCEVQIGDYVVYPSKLDRKINIGIIESDYFFDANEWEYAHKRKVKWLKHLPRTAFSQGALREVGAAVSFFSIKNYADEFLSALDKNFKTRVIEVDENDTVAETTEEIIDNTKDFILKELSKNLKGYDFEGFVADLLRAMGYRTVLSPKGGDSGVDITAYKDELPPRIIVQVKSQDSDIKEAKIQELKGAMREGDYGLFITLSNYTKNALKYLEHTPIIRGISGTELVELILKYYDKLSEKHRKIIPLKMVYIPNVED